MTLDRYDWLIIYALRQDGRTSWARLAEQLHLSASSIQRRTQALQQAGIIRHFTVALDNRALGHEVRAFVQVRINRHDPKAARQFHDAVIGYPEVEACHKISGNTDFMLNITAPDLPRFARFLENRILYLPGVVDARSSIVLETIKENGQAIQHPS
ncbi:MAG: Lrp/AsnC family transcriptional regulator [Thiothrix sp.]|nr:Lrp/AsnC family transcriptional regulator [Thiothrix sp.]HPQ93968.1 Lrp/AsnC family transcriptional regulator [Thiolinea sp.]